MAITCLLNTTVTPTIHDKYSREYSPQITYHFPGYSHSSAVLLDVRHSGQATEGAIVGVDPSLWCIESPLCLCAYCVNTAVKVRKRCYIEIWEWGWHRKFSFWYCLSQWRGEPKFPTALSGRKYCIGKEEKSEQNQPPRGAPIFYRDRAECIFFSPCCLRASFAAPLRQLTTRFFLHLSNNFHKGGSNDGASPFVCLSLYMKLLFVRVWSVCLSYLSISLTVFFSCCQSAGSHQSISLCLKNEKGLWRVNSNVSSPFYGKVTLWNKQESQWNLIPKYRKKASLGNKISEKCQHCQTQLPIKIKIKTNDSALNITRNDDSKAWLI